MEAALKDRPVHHIKRHPKDSPLFMQNGHHRTSVSEDEVHIKEFRRACPQFLAVAVKNTLLFVYGMTLGFPTIVIPAIQGGEGREPSDLVLNREEISWFSSINLICVPLGCLFSGIVSQPIGKRKAMQLVNLPILGSWILFHFASSTEHLYAALCLAGIGGGLMEAPVLTYVAEITEPRYRGILSVLGSTCVIAGIFIQFILGSLLDWRTIAAINTVFPVISIITLFFIPESPTWLVRNEKYHEAIRSLQWLRGWVPEHRVEEEFNTLYDQLITQKAYKKSSEENFIQKTKRVCFEQLRIFRKQSFWLPFALVSFTFFVGHFSGKTALQTYAVQIFHTLKAPINKYHATILLGVAELVATVLSVILIHFTGKRPLVLVSTIGCGLCIFGTATYAYFLNVIPGFAIDNVVVNASLIVPKDQLITVDNITNIFEDQNNPILGNMNNQSDKLIYNTTVTLPKGLDSNETRSDHIERANRSNKKVEAPMREFNPFDDLPIFDYSDVNDTTDAYPENEYTEREPTIPTGSLAGTDVPEKPPNNDMPSQKQIISDILLPIPNQSTNNLAWVPLLLLLGSAFFAHLGIRMIPWILIGEVFSADVRSTASGVVSAVGYIFGFLANKLFLQMLATLTMPGTFWFYSSVSLIGSVVIYFVLPETENKTLAEIEESFSKKTRKTGKVSTTCDQTKSSFGMENQNTFPVIKISLDTPDGKSIPLEHDAASLVSATSPLGEVNPTFESNEDTQNTTHL